MAQAIHELPCSHRVDRVAIAGGALLFDPDRIADPRPRLLDPVAYGTEAHAATARGGRGAVWFVHGRFGDGVLRHYLRGGALARFNRDRYLFHGEERTRPFREFRLLQALHGQGLPVPRPLLAGYRRTGVLYRADILIERIDASRTLAECLRDGAPPPWRAIGAMLARFHAAGAFHADLNAHNILVDGHGKPWLIDFDRGALRSQGRWREENLQRLQRSLHKLARARGEAFDEAGWRSLLAGYQATTEAHA